MSAKVHGKSEGWAWMARRFRKRPFFSFRPEVELLVGGLVIKTPRYKSLLSGLILLGFGGGFVFLVAWPGAREYFHGQFAMYVTAAVGCLLLLGGVHTLLVHNSIRLDQARQELLVTYGSYPLTRRVSLSADEMQVAIWLDEGLDAGLISRLASRQNLGCSFVELCCSDQRMLVAKSRKQGVLTEAYEALRTFLGGRGIDETAVEIELADGERITASRAPLSSSSANFRTMKLRLAFPDVMELQPTLGLRAFFSLCFVFAIPMLVFMLPPSIRGVAEGDKAAWIGVAVSTIVGLVFVIVGLLALAGRLGINTAVFDRRQGVLLRGGRKRPIDDIAAVQVCSKFVEGDRDSPSYVALELNLILRDPAGLRVNLMSHGKEAALRSDAQRLAEFLNVPLLEHL